MAAEDHPASRRWFTDVPGDLETPVRDLMTPGVISIGDRGSLRDAYGAMLAHRVQAVLVVGERSEAPLGWVTARGLLEWLGRDQALARAREAVTEEAVTIHPSATAREAIDTLSRSGASHLLVGPEDAAPEGVLAPLDLLALVRRHA